MVHCDIGRLGHTVENHQCQPTFEPVSGGQVISSQREALHDKPHLQLICSLLNQQGQFLNRILGVLGPGRLLLFKCKRTCDQRKEIEPFLRTLAGFELLPHECLKSFHRRGPCVLQLRAQLHFDTQSVVARLVFLLGLIAEYQMHPAVARTFGLGDIIVLPLQFVQQLVRPRCVQLAQFL